MDEGELRFLEGHAGGATSEFTGKEREKRGAAFAAANPNLDVLTGGGSQVSNLEAALAKLAAGGDEGTSVTSILEQLADDKQREATALEQLAETMKGIGDLANTIDRIREELEGFHQREARKNAVEGT